MNERHESEAIKTPPRHESEGEGAGQRDRESSSAQQMAEQDILRFVRGTCTEAGPPGPAPHPHHFPDVRTQASCLIALCLSSLNS